MFVDSKSENSESSETLNAEIVFSQKKHYKHLNHYLNILMLIIYTDMLYVLRIEKCGTLAGIQQYTLNI